MMRKQFFIPMLVGLLALSAAQAFAQSATVVLRNGERVQGEVMDMGRALSLRVNGAPRQVPINDVVLFDFAGDGRNVPVEEVAKANASGPLVVMRSGEQFNASLRDLAGSPLVASFSNGRKANLSDVGRVYMGPVNNVPGFPAIASNAPAPAPPPAPGDRPSNAPGSARSVVVPSNVQWTNTGINVSRGQPVRFEPSGEIRLSFNGDDIARPAGALSNRRSGTAPIPTIPAGALIGRINNGQPFSIGDPDQAIRMPDDGRLFLGVNDDHVADNSGNYVVRIWEQ
jgi:hypothetical protein